MSSGKETAAPVDPTTQKIRRWHRLSLWALAIIILIFAAVSLTLDLPFAANLALYGLLTAGTLFFMGTTMMVMINKSSHKHRSTNEPA